MSYLTAYFKLLSDTRILSKISSFLMIIFTVIELGDMINMYYKAGGGREWSDVIWAQILVCFGFVSLIAAVFAVRFVLLFRKNIKYVWATQLLWLFGWLSIVAYRLTTAKILGGSVFELSYAKCMDCMYYDTFVGASTGLFLALSAYLYFSPIKQLFVLFYALAPYLKNKNL